MPLMCPSCNEPEPHDRECGYCGLPCCSYCQDLHEQDCDKNPDNEEE